MFRDWQAIKHKKELNTFFLLLYNHQNDSKIIVSKHAFQLVYFIGLIFFSIYIKTV